MVIPGFSVVALVPGGAPVSERRRLTIMKRATLPDAVQGRPRPIRSERLVPRPLRVGLIGTFPPRRCGVATFTADLAASLSDAGDDVVVAALVDRRSSPAPDVAHQLVQTSEESAQAVAASLSTDVDVVVVEHEFGIFGGEGSAVLQALTDDVTVPYVVTLHTVSETFQPWQVAALAAPLAGAALVFVFSEAAVGLLAAQFSGVAERCVVVPHAAPEALFTPNVINLREQLGVPDSTMVMSTFGLLSPSKGIEHVIAAMPEVRRRVGRVVYLVAGRTHPDVVREAGEQYRSELEALTRTLGVADVVQFRDWFHDVDELSSLLHGTDLFVTPYTDAQQIVSGALSFAIAAGVPFVSTPYRYATGLAARGCGRRCRSATMTRWPTRSPGSSPTTVFAIAWRRVLRRCRPNGPGRRSDASFTTSSAVWSTIVGPSVSSMPRRSRAPTGSASRERRGDGASPTTSPARGNRPHPRCWSRDRGGGAHRRIGDRCRAGDRGGRRADGRCGSRCSAARALMRSAGRSPRRPIGGRVTTSDNCCPRCAERQTAVRHGVAPDPGGVARRGRAATEEEHMSRTDQFTSRPARSPARPNPIRADGAPS